jgi:hypothetical protein
MFFKKFFKATKIIPNGKKSNNEKLLYIISIFVPLKTVLSKKILHFANSLNSFSIQRNTRYLATQTSKQFRDS